MFAETPPKLVDEPVSSIPVPKQGPGAGVGFPTEFRAMRCDISRRFPTIVLVSAQGEDRKVIRTAHEAAQLLLKDWPIDDGEEFFAAVRICLRVLTGHAEPDAVHEAIIRAAHEAGITAVTTDPHLGIFRIYPGSEACSASAYTNPAAIDPLRLSPSARRRRQRKWSGRSRKASSANVEKASGCVT